jgi:sulfur-oxidizing protein SoxB
MDRRAFLEALAVAAASGLPLASRAALSGDGREVYDLPTFGNASLLHFTDCHAQLLPVHFREPNVNLGIGPAVGKPPHLVGEHFLRAYKIAQRTRNAYAFTYLEFERAAKVYGRMGGFAHMATLVKRLKASRPGSLLLDGGDN